MLTPLPFLQNHPLTAGLPSDQLTEAAARMRIRAFKAGDVLIKEGEPGESCFWIMSGEVEVYARNLIGLRVRLAKLGSESLIGEMALVQNERRTASVSALTDGLALMLDRASFNSLAENCPTFHERLLRLIRHRSTHGKLRKMSIWSGLPDEHLRRLAEVTISVPISKGAAIIREGEAGDAFYMVIRGKYEVWKNEKRIAVLGPGDFFGEIALLADLPRTSTVQAASEGELLMMSREHFLQTVHESGKALAQIEEIALLRQPSFTTRFSSENENRDSSYTVDTWYRPLSWRNRWLQVMFGGLALFALFTFLAASTGWPVLKASVLFFGASVGPVAFVAYVRDSQLLQFRTVRLAAAFAVSAGIAVPLAWWLESRFVFADGTAIGEPQSYILPLWIAVIEEFSKLLALLLVFRAKSQRFFTDAIVFGTAAGMGFACLESMLYGLARIDSTSGMLTILWIRTLLSPLGHGIWTGLMAAGWWRLQHSDRGSDRVGKYFYMLGAVLLHFAWNLSANHGVIGVLGQLTVGVIGILALLRLIHQGIMEETRALLLINPELKHMTSVAEPGMTKELHCHGCGTSSPQGAAYCARCGLALTLDSHHS